MRLLRTDGIELCEFTDGNVPPYAILSHTWETEEVSLQEMENPDVFEKEGFKKIQNFCSVAKARGFSYGWIDTCCIDKTSSAELSEAINSMFRWYQEAGECYAFLSDVSSKAEFSRSKWFTRGWTLQELIAPSTIIFYNWDWKELGTRHSLQQEISTRTRIPRSVLLGDDDLDTYSVAQKMSWAAKRETTRIEDRAYCLLGIFGINMPLIYGEKETAFMRLQEEIMKISDDCTLFAWEAHDTRGGILATSPAAFADSQDIVESELIIPGTMNPVVVSARGIHLDVCFMGISDVGVGLVILPCKRKHSSAGKFIALFARDPSLEVAHLERIRNHELIEIELWRYKLQQYPLRRVCIRKGRVTHQRDQGREQNHHNYYDGGLPAPGLNSLSDQIEKLKRATRRGDPGEMWLLLTRSDVLAELGGQLGAEVLALAIQGIHNAVKCGVSTSGPAEVLKILVGGREINANAVDELGCSPLLRLSKIGCDIAMRPLVRSGRADIELRDATGRTSLSWAAGNSHHAATEFLIQIGANIESKDTSGRTPLSWAAGKSNSTIIQLLLQMGADIESRDESGRTPLSWAAGNSHHEATKALLQHGASIESKDEDGRTPLSHAAEEGASLIVQILIDAGAEVSSEDGRNGWAPYSWAISKGHHSTMFCLLRAEADADPRFREHHQTLFIWAASQGYKKPVAYMIEQLRRDVNEQDADGQTALWWAASNGHEVVVELLLRNGADVNQRNKHGTTALWQAAFNGHKAIFTSLLDNGADLESKDNDGKSVLAKAVENGQFKLIELLLERGAIVDNLDQNGNTPLFSAALGGNEYTAELLLERGASVNSLNSDGNTPLFHGAIGGNWRTAQLLLKRGAAVDSRNSNGNTPLFYAVLGGHMHIAQLLLERGANVNSLNSDGRTPLSWASRKGHEEVAELLLRWGAIGDNLNVTDGTPLSGLSQRGYEEVAESLLERRAKMTRGLQLMFKKRFGVRV